MTTMDGPAALGPAGDSTRERRAHPSLALAPVGAGLALGGLLLVGDDGLSPAELVRVGLVVAWGLSRWMASLLFEVNQIVRVDCTELRALGRIAHAEQATSGSHPFSAGLEFLTLRLPEGGGTFYSTKK